MDRYGLVSRARKSRLRHLYTGGRYIAMTMTDARMVFYDSQRAALNTYGKEATQTRRLV